MTVFSPAWWQAAGLRAAYTALAALLPQTALLVAGTADPVHVLLIVAAALVLSFATSLLNLPEVTSTETTWWRAVIVRVLKTTGQVAVPVLTTAVLLTDVDWRMLLVQIGGASLTTLVRVLIAYLPEVEPVGILVDGFAD